MAKVSTKISIFSFSVCILQVILVLIYHYSIDSKYKDSRIFEGQFAITKNDAGELIETVAIEFRPGEFRIVDINQVAKPFLFRDVAYFQRQLTSRFWEKMEGNIFEVGKGYIAQKTGSLKWRFFSWGIIGGSKVKLDIITEKNIESILMMKFDMKDRQGRPPLPITTPIFVTITLLIVSFVSWLKGTR